MENTLKLPPQNIEAEQSVLGAMILDEDAIARVLELVNTEHFYKTAHQKIFKAITNLYNNGQGVDLVILQEALNKNNCLEEVGGVMYLTTLADAVPVISHIEHYAGIIREKAMLRAVIKNCMDITGKAFVGPENVPEFIELYEKSVFKLTQQRENKQSFLVKDLIKATQDQLDEAHKKKNYITGLAVGYEDLDKKTGGFQKGDYIILAGRPSMGKSSLALNIADNVASFDRAVAFFSLEMSREQLMIKLVCGRAQVDSWKTKAGQMDPQEWGRITDSMNYFHSTSKIIINDTPGISPTYIRSEARRLKSEFPELSLVIIDYLQLMHYHGKGESREQMVSEASKQVKTLARELNLPVLVLSQLNRQVESRADNEPLLSDLRESGSLEQDADVVLMMWKPKDRSDNNEHKVKIAKQRNGPVGAIDLIFHKEWTRFESKTKNEEEW